MDLRVPRTACLLVMLGAVFALASAWYFQLVVGLAPCPLCLTQRIPYYVGAPLALAGLLLAGFRQDMLARLVLAVLALLMLANAGIATYHAGVEWHLWQGPTACAAAPPMVVNDIMAALQKTHVPRCDEAPWRLFGLSMAGWNAFIALALAGIAALGALGRAPRRA